MKYAFIGGIPTAGKSRLAKIVARKLGIAHFETDGWRKEFRSDPEMRAWVDFFRNQNEEKYWRETDCAAHWKNIECQSEALWPAMLEKIRAIQTSGAPAIFEGVNILPRLAGRGLGFPGIYLLGESFELVFARNRKNPRWGNTEALQFKEARAFWDCERPRYEAEARQYGFKTFSDSALAERELFSLLRA
ncbi:MAG: hypothetical protein KGI73_04610 [Patescibacteria group bacterium]|nr:hypothetical protein [Patescibacteria group bacterium]